MTLHLPIGTRYANRHVQRDSYRVDGGRLLVTYVDSVVKSIYTSSRRYRTADGLGVGATLSRGRCRISAYGSCEYFWRTYQFDDCGNAWLDESPRLEVAIYMDRSLFVNRRGRITGFEFGDPNVVLYCF